MYKGLNNRVINLQYSELFRVHQQAMSKLLLFLKDGGSSAKKQDVPRSEVKSRCKPSRNPEPTLVQGTFQGRANEGACYRGEFTKRH